MRFILFAHGGSGNHGCEALIRTIPEIIKKEIKGAEFVVATFTEDEDLKYGVNSVEYISYSSFSKCDPRRYLDKILRMTVKTGVMRKKVIAPVVKDIRQDDIWISIGGDNYSYPGVIPYDIINVHKAVKAAGAKSILWGCSINKENIAGTILDDLKNYDAIIARESLTYKYLKEGGIEDSKLYLYPDSAFTLETRKCCERIDEYKPYIGINISPVVLTNGGTDSVIYKNYSALIGYIIEKTGYNVALIPHVVWQNSDDREPLKLLNDEFKSTGRVFMVDDQSACCLKSIIASSEIFVGARTHATIAAYSSGVPTLVVGYSVKSIGIATDIFGTAENYVVKNTELENEMDLTDAFRWIDENKLSVKTQLQNRMPEYIRSARDAGSVVRQLVKG